eukprot:13845081-Alexandrium_andersonii.AAC.1
MPISGLMLLGSLTCAGGGVELVTCKAHGSREWRRRDFVLCNARAKPWVREVWTESQAGFDVHLPLFVTFEAAGCES